VDNKAGARLAIAHLYELGHRRIAFIRGPKRVVDSAHRWAGISEFAKERALALDPKLIVELKDTASSSEAGFGAMTKLLRSGARFTAVMAFDDMTAFGAVRALTQAEMKVPERCSVVGFDDVAAAAFYNPPLTTVRQSMEELGSLGASIFLRGIQSAPGDGTKSQRTHRKVEPLLVVRASTSAA